MIKSLLGVILATVAMIGVASAEPVIVKKDVTCMSMPEFMQKVFLPGGFMPQSENVFKKDKDGVPIASYDVLRSLKNKSILIVEVTRIENNFVVCVLAGWKYQDEKKTDFPVK